MVFVERSGVAVDRIDDNHLASGDGGRIEHELQGEDEQFAAETATLQLL